MVSFFNLIFVFLVFLCIGSFLNVVIYRLPRELSLFLPRSNCPLCAHPLLWYHNIPLFSYIKLKGKCAFCHGKISSRYWMVELLTALTGLLLFWQFGLTFNFAFVSASLFSLFLIAMIFIDAEHQLLPDILTLSLLWIGLLVNIVQLFSPLQDAILGAVFGYLSLWCVAKIYHVLTGIEGMGHGDFKLLAALGAWLGWQDLLNIILIASLLGLTVGFSLILSKKAHSRTPLPFGPYLAIAGFIMLLLHH